MGNRKSAVEFYNAALNALNDKSQPSSLQHAYQLFSSAVYADHTFGEGWYGLGNANFDLQIFDAAVAAYRRGLRCELELDHRNKMLVNMGWALHSMGRVDEAITVLGEAIKGDSELATAWLNLGICAGTCGFTDEAVTDMRKAVKLEPNDPVMKMGLAFALLFDGQLQEGFKEFEIRFKYKLHQFLKYPYPKWDGTPGQTLFLVADQGLGDTLSFARFVPRALERCKYIHMVVQSELLRCFEQTFIGVPNLNIIPLSSPFLEADAWATFVGLPAALGLTTEEIKQTSQITPPVYSLPTSWMALDAKFHIGIAWAGSPLNDIDRHRNLPLRKFLELYRVPGIQLYSLQVGERSKDLVETGSTALIRDLSPYIHDVVDTVSLLRDLDLVICCESALGHICAAANKECWIPYSYLGHDYRIGRNGEQLLWTPKHRIFKQDASCSWDTVFKKIVTALGEKVNETVGQMQGRGKAA